MIRATSTLLLAVPLLIVTASAAAQELEGQGTSTETDAERERRAYAEWARVPCEPIPDSAEPAHAPSRLVLGAVGTALVAYTFDGKSTEGIVGGGVFAEYTLVPDWLAVELDVRLVGEHEKEGGFAVAMPVDLLFKKPFEISDAFEAYVGIGGTLAPVFSNGEVRGGIASVIGSYLWLARSVALVTEIDWNLIFGGPDVVGEVGFSVGVALGV